MATKDKTATTEVVNDAVPPALDLKDLALALQIISTAIKRGAYEPSELSLVGKTHEKIAGFLQYQAELQAAAKAETETAKGEEEDES